MKELSVEATVANIGTVTAFVEEALEAAGCPMKTMMQIDVAIDELFGNIARYAYAPRTGTAVVRVETDEAAREVSLTFEDSGVPFDPVKKQDPDITLSAKDRKPGGLGIFITKKLMDEIAYEYRNGRNVLSFSKKL